MSNAVKNLPEGWIETPISELSEIVTKGTTPTTLGFKYINEKEILFVKVESIKDLSIDHTLCAYIDEEANQALKRSQLKENDVLISIAGTLGRIGIVKAIDLPANTNQALAIIRPTKAILPKFLAYSLNSETTKVAVNSSRRGVGLQNLNLQQIKNLRTLLPPLSEQKRIADKIEALQAKSKKAKQALETAKPLLDKLRQSILASAFRGDLTADWHKKNPDVEPASVLLERIRAERREKWEENELAKMRAKGKEPKNDKWKSKYKEPEAIDVKGLPELPNGWCWASAEELTTVVTDGEHQTPKRSESGMYLLSARNIQNGYISYEKVDYISKEVHERLKQRLKVEPGDILMSCSGSLGRSCVAPTNSEFSLVRSVAVLKPVEKMGRYMSLAIRSPFLQDEIDQKKTQTAQSNIFQGKIKTLRFPLAPFEEQKEIVKKAEQLLTMSSSVESNLKKQTEKIDVLDQSILKKAFKGELVNQDPSDEPAKDLLKRINND